MRLPIVTTYTKEQLSARLKTARRLHPHAVIPALSRAWSIRRDRNERARSLGRIRDDAMRNAMTRLRHRLIHQYSLEIARRGGEIAIDDTGLRVVDRQVHPVRLALLGCDGWRQYSRRHGSWRVSLRYLCGHDDNGIFAVRVSGSVETVAEAIAWLEPAAVRQARADGREVLRQGDVYAIQMRRDCAEDSAAALNSDSHQWDAASRTLKHRPTDGAPHAPLHVPWPAKFVQQRAYEMGRSGRRADAD